MTVRFEPRLAIDADAAALRLSGGELEGPWQLPAELARRAFRSGARHVAVTCDRRGFTVRDDGPALEADTLADLSRAQRRDEEALARLESGPQAELRFLVAEPRGSAEVTCRPNVAIAWRGVAWDAERARDWLRSVGRFAGRAIALDGETLPPPPLAGLAGATLDGPWPGELVLTTAGDDGVIWLLADRMVRAFLVVPGAFPFEAVADVSAAGPHASAAVLREQVAPVVPSWIDQAARLTAGLAERREALEPAALARLRVLLLKAARLPRWRGAALRAAVYPARTGEQRTWLSLVDLGRPEMADADRRVATCTPAELARSLFLGPAPAAILEAAERGRLSQELGLRFRTVPRAERGAHAPPCWRTRLRDWTRGLVPGGRPLSDDALEPAERGLLHALRRTGGVDVRFRPGRGGVRRVRDAVQIARDHPLVRAAVESVGRDPAWAFPAAVALLGRLGTKERHDWRALAGFRLAAPDGGGPRT